MNFKGAVVLVTGSSRGIGAGVAKQFAAYGAQVVVHYHNGAEAANRLAEEILSTGAPQPLCISADVSSEEAIKNMISTIKEKFGSLSVVVNNAGVSIDGLLPRFRVEDMDKLWQVNLRSAMLVSKHAFSLLSRSGTSTWGHPGALVNMSSVVGISGNAGQSIYAATKAGLIAMTKSLAKEYAPRGIRVNAIAPGFIETDMTRSLPAETQQKYTEAIPLGRMGGVEDVARLCCFLASSDAAYITGQVVSVDGGLSL